MFKTQTAVFYQVLKFEGVAFVFPSWITNEFLEIQ